MNCNQPTLFIFSGLPGVGKTTLAKLLASSEKAVFLRIDTIEQAIRDLCDFKVEGEGYRLAYRVAKDNLLLGSNVIADCCNPITLTRDEWRSVASSAGARYQDIEVICSDSEEHRHRVATRQSDIPMLDLPNWLAIQQRDYHPWPTDRIVIDTANISVTESFNKLETMLAQVSA